MKLHLVLSKLNLLFVIFGVHLVFWSFGSIKYCHQVTNSPKYTKKEVNELKNSQRLTLIEECLEITVLLTRSFSPYSGSHFSRLFAEIHRPS